jgi:hypothetical protein
MKPKGQHFFDFYTGAQKMPAGRYTIGIDLERQMITFTDESGKQRMFLMGAPDDEGDGTSLLVFMHLGMCMRSTNSRAMPLTGYQTRMPVLAIESRNTSSQVEVALNR